MSKLRLIVIIASLTILVLSSHAAVTKETYVGETIPKFLSTESRLIFSGSDSLFLNGRLLNRDSDYSFSREDGGYDLSTLAVGPNDTLVVSYRTAPGWLVQSFGNSIAEIAPHISQSPPSQMPIIPSRLQTAVFSDISISGAKTFRFATQSTGTSDFGQSLDLNIEGNLAENLKITGAISDRGFNPSYGTSNSRLEELDKVNLRLESNSLKAQVGDIQLGKRLYQQSTIDKKISGASFDMHSSRFNINGVAAKPKGRFNTAQFNGLDAVQGPYQIGEVAQIGAIVPNSEVVWLDGATLVRGSDNDYTMDYPTGRITFTVKHLIDRRSRMEIDYEPVSTEYETELFSTGSSYKVGDSAFYAAIEWYREGDVSGQPQTGELSESDKQLLQSAGDNSSLAFRSGTIADTSGDYIINPGSLPDTVYQFIGDGSGDYSVTFSFVGTGQGEYRFVGGKEYLFVGTNDGDYLPVVKLPLPERTEFYTSKFGLNNEILGSVQAEVSLSQNDQNLLSSLEDDNNEGLLLNLDSRKQFSTNGQSGNLQLRLRMKEAAYDARSRINTADFNRHYLTPFNFTATTDERLYGARSEISPLKNVNIHPFFGRLDYKNRFVSDKFEIGANLGSTDKVNGNVSWGTTDAQLTDSLKHVGKADIWRGTISSPIIAALKVTTEYEHDRRTNDYLGVLSGLRFNRYAATVERSNEKITYEYYTEDSLYTDWTDFLKRNRVSGSSSRRLGNINYTAYLGYQWLARQDDREESFLGRTNLQYSDARKQLSMAAAYTLSEETRNARGLTYLEVEPGQGNFSFENDRYVPDPNGNYIQVEELLSDKSKVNRGEKSFQLSKNWKTAQIRFNSNIEEELLEKGSRQIWWLVPFISDGGQAYLVYNRNYNSEQHFFPIKGGHVVNIALDEKLEIRSVSGIPRSRRDRAGSLALKQVFDKYFLEQRLRLFSSDRDNYFIGAGEIDGYQTGASIRRLITSSEYSFGAGFRRAKSAANEISEIVSITGETRIRLIEKGELRSSLEVYSQNLQNVTGFPSYQLTDNKYGTKGAIWSTGFNYNVRKGMRINFNLSGRHSNETTARLVGRTEVVAEF